MTALRQEALQIVNAVPENLLAEIVSYLRKLQIQASHNFTEEELKEIFNSDAEPKKAAALADIEEWQKRNRDILNSDIDWDKELEAALNEKYGLVD